MSNHLLALLKSWYPLRDFCGWVLGTVYKTEGPCYRKAGAMMLFSADGHQLGMLSGGCLESDIHQQARRVMQSGRAVTLTYDGSDEDDLSFQLGIGCGGTVHILLQPVHRENGYLELDRVYTALQEFRSGYYYQCVPEKNGAAQSRFMDNDAVSIESFQVKAQLVQEDESHWLCTGITPPPHLLIVGGGIDARPLAAIGHQLGWRISVWDPRPANARREYFPDADELLSVPAEHLPEFVRSCKVNAAVLMSHNIALDARALLMLHGESLRYLALLGPRKRREQVIAEAGINPDKHSPVIAGPAGLQIGADLPETIALSILAECQAALNQGSGRSMSGVLASDTPPRSMQTVFS
ncbi:XdhC family protein [Microbulbifer harenosus]|uniref:XdhC family protein n=1 Tax=Microbulbifer harenosus TaxID=2576840 RepID=A0ABY2UJ91_9GAMM|nr:XdhC/CoxI family protein [Microbulbifer harenosus]TLM77746.1 XdhC family protein [Microbulbifer harenosus]